MRVLWIGFGDIATRCCARLDTSTWQVTAVNRSGATAKGVKNVLADITAPASLNKLESEFSKADIVVLTLTPGARDTDTYRRVYLEGLKLVLANIGGAQPHVIWASSTSVYGQNNGEWVDEASPAEPTSETGKILRQAEQLLEASGHNYTVIRYAGIYHGFSQSPQSLLAKVRNGVVAPLEPEHFTNRIHRDDCAAVMLHLMQRIAHKLPVHNLYLAVDDCPASAADVTRGLAKLAGSTITQELASQRGGSKRCSNKRLKDEGFSFQYPSWREGYSAAIKG